MSDAAAPWNQYEITNPPAAPVVVDESFESRMNSVRSFLESIFADDTEVRHYNSQRGPDTREMLARAWGPEWDRSPWLPGLSTSHISPQELRECGGVVDVEVPDSIIRDEIQPQVECWLGGELVKVRRRRMKRRQRGGGKRGRITGFSENSRRNLQRKVAQLRRDRLPLFVALTYPDDFPRNHRIWKRHLDSWFKRLEREFPRAACIWRQELIDRKSGVNQGEAAPHFHLLLYGSIPLSWEFKRWLSRSWYEVVASGDERHLRAGTRVERIRSHRGVKKYVSKAMARITGELSKVTQVIDGGVGRWWGVFNKELLPWGARVVLSVSQATANNAIRYLRRFAKIRTRAYLSLTGMGNGEQWLRAIAQLEYG